MAGQLDVDREPAQLAAARRDPPAHRLDEAPNDSQADARARRASSAGVAAIEPVEHPRERGIGHAGPRILDSQAHEAVVRLPGRPIPAPGTPGLRA